MHRSVIQLNTTPRRTPGWGRAAIAGLSVAFLFSPFAWAMQDDAVPATPTLLGLYLEDEVFRTTKSIEWMNRRIEQIAARREQERAAGIELKRKRAAAIEAYLEAEWLAASPAQVIAAQRDQIKRLEADLAAQQANLEKLTKAAARFRAAREKADAEAAKKFEQVKKRSDEQTKALDEQTKALREANEGLAKELEDAQKETREFVRNSKIAIDRLKERALGDFETERFDGIDFVRIPAGEFVMGTPPADRERLEALGGWRADESGETPARLVRITKPFLISTREITQAQYDRIMRKSNFAFKGDALPAETLTWNHANDFAERLGRRGAAVYRLPTEAEWEYCARAGGEGPFGRAKNGLPITLDVIGHYAWTAADSESKTHPVGEKTPNAWGLYDMLGGVWEWCEDWFDPDYYAASTEEGGAAIDPRGPDKGVERVFRGGAWALDPQHSRAAIRGGNLPLFRSQFVGFRIVRELSD